MRILYHHRTLADGAEGVHIGEMVAALRGLGHEVHVVGLAAADSAGARRDWIERLRSRLPQFLFELASVASNGVEYFGVRRALRAYRPDFVYKRHARHDVAALLAARRAGVPSVLEVNCLFTAPGYQQFEPLALPSIAAALERRAMRLASVVLAVSTPLARQISQLSGVASEVMANGADPRAFDPDRADSSLVRSRYGLGGGFVIGWTGVLRDWHGLELLLEALERLPEARLLVVGDGPARPALETAAAVAGVLDRLVITGRIPHHEMPAHVAAMDVAVVAHERTGVASPMKLLEYMAMAKPVVAPRLDNIRDVVDDGRNGLLFSPGDAADLARVLSNLRQDRALATQLGRAARATVTTVRNWPAMAARVVHLVSKHRGTAKV